MDILRIIICLKARDEGYTSMLRNRLLSGVS